MNLSYCFILLLSSFFTALGFFNPCVVKMTRCSTCSTLSLSSNKNNTLFLTNSNSTTDVNDYHKFAEFLNIKIK